jgi:DHA1 family bicyclomycin/chloramphenicol resistance-like MFS transporter
MFIFLLGWDISYERLFIPMALFTFGRGISQPSAQSSALNCARSASATASGMLGFIQLTIGALIAQIAPMAFQSNIIALPAFLIIASLAAWVSFEIGKSLV